MSASASNRHAADTSRRPSTTSGAKLRGPSSRVATKERPLSSGEVIPEDSASNAAPRKSASEAHKVNGRSRTASERQTGRAQLATRDNFQIRTRSPVKVPAGEDEVARTMEERVPSRQNERHMDGQTHKSREKKALRRF